MNCKKCGGSLEQNFKFCPFCGSQVVLESVYVPTSENVQSKVQPTNVPNMVCVRSGSFNMGDNEFNRKISLLSFALSETPITQRQFEYVMGKNPSKLVGSDNPVESVNWCEAIIFCNTLSMMQNLVPCYTIGNMTNFTAIDASSPLWKRVNCNFVGNGYRLPTEAEWEYAARGGLNHDTFQYAGSNNIAQVAWYGENSGVSSHPVGTKAPNSLGLYDMCGNVSEWCWDYMGELSIQPQTNPHGPQIGTMHVKRGGGWLDDAEQCSVYFRSGSAPTGKSSVLGFRVARSLIENVM